MKKQSDERIEAGRVVMIPVERLREHPKARGFWGQGEERKRAVAALRESVGEYGVREPLTITACRDRMEGEDYCSQGTGCNDVSKRGEVEYVVIDGCTRLAAAREVGLKEVPCLVVAAGSEEEIEDEIFIRNMQRTSFSSGFRVMRYLEKHEEAVLFEARENANAAARGRQGGRGNKAGINETSFSAGVIAERLKVSKMDVLAGIELLKCRAEGLVVRVVQGKRELYPATDDEMAAVWKAYGMVLEGVPLRRWVPAMYGKVKTEGLAKPPTEWGPATMRTMQNLERCWRNWGEVSAADKMNLIEEWKEHLGKMPAEILMATRKLLGV